MTTKNLWMVRAGQGGVLVDTFEDEGYCGTGSDVGRLGPIAPGESREAITQRLRQLYPGRKDGRNINAAGQLYRFHNEVAVGDDVITYDPGRRIYLLGTVAGPVSHDPESDETPYQRPVTWTRRVLRDSLMVSTRNTLGSTLAIFRPNEEAAGDVRSKAIALDAPETAAPSAEPSPETEADAAVFLNDVEGKSKDFIEDLIASLDPDEMEDLVAGILRAMGYKTRTSPKGPDRGVDIFASPDGLGLREPRIFVEVKHRKASMGAPEIRAFLGGRQQGDRCLFVSTGGFTKEALYEAERASVPLTLIDLPSLRELLVEHYETADTETRRLVPLTRIYWPATAEAGS